MKAIKQRPRWLRIVVCIGGLAHLAWGGFAYAQGMTNAKPSSTSVMRIIYPADEDKDDGRFADLREILTMALEKTKAEFGPYELQSSLNFMNGRRARASLDSGELTVIWTSTSVEKEKALLPIRIPIRKGILGYRVLLINADQQAHFDRIQKAADLKDLRIGQGTGWDDGRLYRHLGTEVVEAKYSNLFRMLRHERFDAIPLGINEAMASLQRAEGGEGRLTIEKNILIYYPWPYYFFVARHQEVLHKRLETGLRLMLKDGSLDAIFWKYNAKAIEQLNLKQRRLIRIENPLLPPETPLKDASLWYTPNMHK